MTGATTEKPALATRGYQQEMLDESLRRNIIIALDTGAGKTHIALLRMKLEAEREATKVSWFLAPTVTLCEQQKSVIEASLPVPVGYITGSQEPGQWKDAQLWRRVLQTHGSMVTTPQVLLDALRHGYVNMGRDISLIVFDEAHHATAKHPYRLIMKEFYFQLPERDAQNNPDPGNVRPMIMGLTASPIYGGDAERAFREIESNLDSTIRAPVIHRAELATFVHRPVFKHAMYNSHESRGCFSTNLASLKEIQKSLNIEEDPSVKLLRHLLKKSNHGSDDWRKIDQKLSKALHKQDTFVHRGINEFVQSASHLFETIGTWSADWFVYTIAERVRVAANPYDNMISTWKNQEKKYLLKVLERLHTTPPSICDDDVLDEISPKVTELVKTLLEQKAEAEAHNELYSGIVFVERRVAVLALAAILEHHPSTKDVFKIGCLVGQSDGSYRHSLLDITRHIRKDGQDKTLKQFRTGDKNLLICTAVAEEGLDIQACGSVIRWDPPQNMPSWAQSRGRARRQRSTYTLMFSAVGTDHNKVLEWEEIERRMVELYNSTTRPILKNDIEDDGVEEDNWVLRIEGTGAKLTLHSAISHLSHFCSVIPSTTHVDTRPLFEIFPPDLPVGWHAMSPQDRAIQASSGPVLYGSTVTLPRCLPIPERQFTVPQEYRSKISAHRHAAFLAYSSLYEHKLLNEHLLPITSVVEPNLDDEVKEMLKDVEKRSGMSKVSLQMNPWIPDVEVETEMLVDHGWWCSRLIIENLAVFDFYTRREPPEWPEEDAPVLHHPERGTLKVLLTEPRRVGEVVEAIDEAREYTRNFLFCFYGTRMRWDQLDFPYLLSPCGKDRIWEDRYDEVMSSMEYEDSQLTQTCEDQISVRADVFGEMFDYPDDITIVKKGIVGGKPYCFVRWRTEDEPLTEEEEEEMRLSHKDEDLEITYPLLVVRPLPARKNFLVPVTSKKDPDAPVKYSHLLPNECRIPLFSPIELECAILMPSVLRAVAMSFTARSLSGTVLAGSPVSEIPISSLIPAISAPAAGERDNYQRLETLGDTVLKFVTSLQLFAQFPLWHEGYLARRKDHTVANGRLAKENLSRKMYRWIIRDRLLIKKWKPLYESTMTAEKPLPDPEPEAPIGPKEKKASKTQNLSTKVLADVVESLIGAAYLYGGMDLGFESIRFFRFGMTWEPIPDSISKVLSRVGNLENPPSQLANVEEMIGYTFTNKLLLIEALTHASYESELQAPSYERLEFLGDAVLDMIVTDYLYRAPGKKYSPGHIHLRRSAVVNALFLAYICLRTSTVVESFMPQARTSPSLSHPGLEDSDSPPPSSSKTPRIRLAKEKQEIHLWKCMLHSSPRILEDQKNADARFFKWRSDIESSLYPNGGDKIFPWAALTRLQAPKFISDIVESIIGAVYLDSRGDMSASGAVQRVLHKLGILGVLEWIVRDNVDIFHPVSRVAQWASKRGKKVEYKFAKEKGMVSCVVLLDEEEVRVKREEVPVLSETASAAVSGLKVVVGDAGGRPCREGQEGTEQVADDGLVVLKVVDAYRGKVSEGEVKFAAAEAAIRAFKLRDVNTDYEIMKKKKSPPKNKSMNKNKMNGVTVDKGKGKAMDTNE